MTNLSLLGTAAVLSIMFASSTTGSGRHLRFKRLSEFIDDIRKRSSSLGLADGRMRNLDQALVGAGRSPPAASGRYSNVNFVRANFG